MRGCTLYWKYRGNLVEFMCICQYLALKSSCYALLLLGKGGGRGSLGFLS
jgi:hypothetical protein